MTDAPALVIRDYDGLVAAFRARQSELGLTVERIDELSGLPSGYTGKLLGASQVKSIGPLALGLLLETLGLELVARPDAAATQKMLGRYGKRVRPAVHAVQGSMRAKSKRFPSVLFKIMSARGHAAYMQKVSPERRREIARRAARARWRAARKSKRARP